MVRAGSYQWRSPRGVEARFEPERLPSAAAS
jgi:hypothetical protein